ncbi:MAG TPA: heme-copper oxidase subunit III [Thermopetrobacter sp.]|nr:heme-copper oxidase subunit III [Thermopetrobacter sp.]
MTDHTSATHEHHWEYSWAPVAVVGGIFFLVVLGFTAWFQYESAFLLTLFAGIGTPMLLAGIAKWIQEGMTQKLAIHNVASIGMPIFIVSEIFIFLSLFASYWMMRLGMDAWPPEGTPHINKWLPLVMTVLLVASSLTYHKGEERLEDNDTAGFVRWLLLTLLLGGAFLAATIWEYTNLVHEGFIPSTNAYSTAFFTLTGFHASHVLLGLLVFVFILLPALRGKVNGEFVKSAGIYWHFVDIVWFFVMSQVYYW